MVGEDDSSDNASDLDSTEDDEEDWELDEMLQGSKELKVHERTRRAKPSGAPLMSWLKTCFSSIEPLPRRPRSCNLCHALSFYRRDGHARKPEGSSELMRQCLIIAA